MAGYALIAVSAFGLLVFRHPLADVSAKAAAPIGAALHVLGAVYRLAVGQAGVGHLLGVGCAADVGSDPLLSLSRSHCTKIVDRRRNVGEQALGYLSARRHRNAADHQIFCRLGQHAASTLERIEAQWPNHTLLHPDAPSCDGGRLIGAVRCHAPQSHAQ